MSTILNNVDLDIYLLYYLDIATIIDMACVSHAINILFKNTLFIRELYLTRNINYGICFSIEYVINVAVQNNYMNLLQWIHNSINPFIYTALTIDLAALYGHDNILEWLHNAKYDIHYTQKTINNAARRNHINILDWLRTHNYDIQSCVYNVVTVACRYGHIDILKWLREYGYSIVCSAYDIDQASGNGFVNILEWFDKSSYGFKYTDTSIKLASDNGHISVLDWFNNSRHIFLYTEGCITNACENNHINILDWFHNSLPRLATMDSDNPGQKVALPFLPGFHNSKYDLLYSEDTIDKALKYNHMDVIKWFVSHGYELKYSVKSINYASYHNNVEVLELLYNLKCRFKYNCDAIIIAIAKKNMEVIRWFEDNNFNFAIMNNGDNLDWTNVNHYDKITHLYKYDIYSLCDTTEKYITFIQCDSNWQDEWRHTIYHTDCYMVPDEW